MIYLIKTEVRNGSYYKVGYTQNPFQRIQAYYTHNPNVKLLEVVKTYNKTKRQLENEIHAEIQSLGFNFHNANNEDSRTGREWFFVDMEHEKEFEHKGLAQFKACRNRKVYKVQ